MKLWDGFCWRVAKRKADRRRKEFFDLLYSGKFEPPAARPVPVLPLTVVSFSGKRDVGEQVLSMWSFLKWVGKPLAWHLYHDGTLEAEDIRLLEKALPGLQVKSWAVALPRLEPSLEFLKGYADWHAMGKRMIAYSTHPLTTPCLFIDSDIVFYAKARAALEAILAGGKGAYMEDGKWGSFDTRYLAAKPTPTKPVNGGFLLVQPGFQWREIWDYIRSLGGTYEYFSDQTAFHISFPKQGALPLDAKEFVVQWTDQFKIGSDFPADKVAARHFVNMVRHKMWEPGWRWHLQDSAHGKH